MRKAVRFHEDVKYHIEKIVSEEGLPDSVAGVALSIYDQFHADRFAGARPPEVYAVAVVHIGTQTEQLPVTINDLSKKYLKHIDDPVNTVAQTKRVITRETGMETLPTPPEAFIERFREEGWIDDEIADKAKELMVQSSVASTGHTSLSAASGAVYAACKLVGRPITQNKLRRKTGVSESTIRKVSTPIIDEVVG